MMNSTLTIPLHPSTVMLFQKTLANKIEGIYLCVSVPPAYVTNSFKGEKKCRHIWESEVRKTITQPTGSIEHAKKSSRVQIEIEDH